MLLDDGNTQGLFRGGYMVRLFRITLGQTTQKHIAILLAIWLAILFTGCFEPPSLLRPTCVLNELYHRERQNSVSARCTVRPA